MRRLIIGLLAVGLPALLLPAAGAGTPRPACFGAAARDPAHPCNNPKLALTVYPTPSEAQITPNAPCKPIDPTINVCEFGTPGTQATGNIALVGDSHASHWRAALVVVARALGWRGVSITRSSCPFSRAITDLSEPLRRQCIRWNRGVLAWFVKHPEVSTVFVSQHPAHVQPVPGRSMLSAEVAGYEEVWRALPATVKHIVVIRDTPRVHEDTLACVQGAIAKREPAGLACAVPRSVALEQDPEAVAAERLHSPRVQLADLTRFICGSRLCYPVVGGVLVYKDSDHLTRVFATTLGPYLLHDVGRLMMSWYPLAEAPPAGF